MLLARPASFQMVIGIKQGRAEDSVASGQVEGESFAKWMDGSSHHPIPDHRRRGSHPSPKGVSDPKSFVRALV